MAFNAIFCYACRQFSTKKGSDLAFTEKGFRSWASALTKKRGLDRHDSSPEHKFSMVKWAEILKAPATVHQVLSDGVLEKRRFYVTHIIKAFMFLIRHKLPFRGSWNGETQVEDGFFNDFFLYQLENNPQLKACHDIIPKSITYASPTIQNEIISILTDIVRRKIVADINDADVNLFTLLEDGTKTKNGEECISIAIRYVKEGKPRESILSMETSQQFDANTFANLTLERLQSYGLDASRMLSQCYDGAATMSGIRGGVQAIIQEKLGKQIPYIHCFNHKLHLVVVKAL